MVLLPGERDGPSDGMDEMDGMDVMAGLLEFPVVAPLRGAVSMCPAP